jgi:hypothetical protein
MFASGEATARPVKFLKSAKAENQKNYPGAARPPEISSGIAEPPITRSYWLPQVAIRT